MPGSAAIEIPYERPLSIESEAKSSILIIGERAGFEKEAHQKIETPEQKPEGPPGIVAMNEGRAERYFACLEPQTLLTLARLWGLRERNGRLEISV